MTGRPSTKLYTPNLLALATELAVFPLDDRFDLTSQVRSRTCGSTIDIGLDLDANGFVSRLGLQVNACAIGQGSAAIMAMDAKGRAPRDFLEAKDTISHWLTSGDPVEEPPPSWPRFDALKPAREHKGRHEALLLAWTAIAQALSTEHSSR